MKSILVVFLVGLVLGYTVAGIEDGRVSDISTNQDTEENAVQTNDGNDDANEPDDLEGVDDAPVTYTSVVDEAVGLRFLYRTAPDAYAVQNIKKTASDDASFIKGYMLMLESDIKIMKESGAMEGPPAIHVSVFKNDQKLFARLWADQYTQYSNINLIRGEESDVVVGGANAIRYQSDGLYATENFIIPHGGYVFLVSGQFIDEESLIRSDFFDVVDSLEFIATR